MICRTVRNGRLGRTQGCLADNDDDKDDDDDGKDEDNDDNHHHHYFVILWFRLIVVKSGFSSFILAMLFSVSLLYM
jgi:ABC-type Zn2+ transport system substrate-binding protein/surface adhesin